MERRVGAGAVGGVFNKGFRYFISLPIYTLQGAVSLVDDEDFGETNGLTFYVSHDLFCFQVMIYMRYALSSDSARNVFTLNVRVFITLLVHDFSMMTSEESTAKSTLLVCMLPTMVYNTCGKLECKMVSAHPHLRKFVVALSKPCFVRSTIFYHLSQIRTIIQSRSSNRIIKKNRYRAISYIMSTDHPSIHAYLSDPSPFVRTTYISSKCIDSSI